MAGVLAQRASWRRPGWVAGKDMRSLLCCLPLDATLTVTHAVWHCVVVARAVLHTKHRWGVASCGTAPDVLLSEFRGLLTRAPAFRRHVVLLWCGPAEERPSTCVRFNVRPHHRAPRGQLARRRVVHHVVGSCPSLVFIHQASPFSVSAPGPPPTGGGVPCNAGSASSQPLWRSRRSLPRLPGCTQARPHRRSYALNL